MHSQHPLVPHEFYPQRHAPHPLPSHEFIDGNIIITSSKVEGINNMSSLPRMHSPRHLLPHELNMRGHSPRPLHPQEFIDESIILTPYNTEGFNYRVMEESTGFVRGPSRISTEPFMPMLSSHHFLPHDLFDENAILFPSDSDNVEDFNINMIMEEFMRSNRMVPASKTAIESLNRVKIEKNADLEKCTICLEDFIDGMEVSAMPCKHVYHQQCITQWLEISHFCPLCSYSISI